MKHMKKILTLALALALAGAMATTAMAAPGNDPTGAGTSTAETEKFLLKVNTSGNGQIAGTDDGSNPEGSEESPMQSLVFNMDNGATAKLLAIPDEGNIFVCWLNEDTQEIYSENAALTVTMDAPLNLKAVFDTNAEKCTVKVDSYGEGQIVASDFDNEDPEFDDEYPLYSLVCNVVKGDTVTLKAKPDKGYKLMGWLDKDTMEILSEEETFVLTADKDYNIIAAFDLDAERRIITVDTVGDGEIAFTQDGTDPEFEENPYQTAHINIAEGRTLTLKARASEGFKFVCWLDKDGEEILSMDETYSFDVSKDVNITACFEPDVETVLIKANTEGQGQIAGSNEGTEPEFDEEFPMQSLALNTPVGDTVVLIAKADDGWTFAGWKDNATGEIVSKEAKYEFEASKALELIAVFTDGNAVVPDDNNDPENNNNTPVDNNNTPSGDNNVPATGNTASAAVLAAVAAASLGAAVLGMKRRKEQN